MHRLCPLKQSTYLDQSIVLLAVMISEKHLNYLQMSGKKQKMSY